MTMFKERARVGGLAVFASAMVMACAVVILTSVPSQVLGSVKSISIERVFGIIPTHSIENFTQSSSLKTAIDFHCSRKEMFSLSAKIRIGIR